MKIYFKVTSWESYDISDVPEEVQQEVIEAVKSGKLECWEDLVEITGEGHQNDLECQLETTEYMPISENDNQATIEVSDDDGFTVIATNEK